MTDIVERLGFDAVICELQFSKGVAGNIEEAMAEIERLRAALKEISEHGYDVQNDDAYPLKQIARAALRPRETRGRD